MAESNGTNSSDRLDRIERIVEALSTTHRDMQSDQAEMQQNIRILLKSQVLMTESFQKLVEEVNRLSIGLRATHRESGIAASQQDLYRIQLHTDERLDALTKVAEEWIRGQRPSNRLLHWN